MGKAATKAQNKYISKVYDRINYVVPKGHKDVIQAAATAQGQSVNAYITQAVDDRIAREQSIVTDK